MVKEGSLALSKKRKNLFKRKKILMILFFFLLVLILFFNIKTSNKKEHSNCEIKIFEPQRKTYNSREMNIDVHLKNCTWVRSSFDGKENITECYNCTRYTWKNLEFDEGEHTIDVYADDINNKTAHKRVIFNIVVK